MNKKSLDTQKRDTCISWGIEKFSLHAISEAQQKPLLPWFHMIPCYKVNKVSTSSSSGEVTFDNTDLPATTPRRGNCQHPRVTSRKVIVQKP